MAVQILDGYPPGTARGNSCYACGAGQRELRDADGKLRRERVVDFGQAIDFEGYMMLCEQCVLEAARLLGYVPSTEADGLRAELDQANAALAESQQEVAEARELVASLRAYDQHHTITKGSS